VFEFVSVLRDFFDKGGDVLYSILFLSVWLSWLILDRYFYFLKEHSDRVERACKTWQKRSETSSWFASVERRSLISKVEIEMSRGLKLIPSIIALLPMFGLLGTVTGMIQVFDVMAVTVPRSPNIGNSAIIEGISFSPLDISPSTLDMRLLLSTEANHDEVSERFCQVLQARSTRSECSFKK
jgi:hypothetical protein